jgi:murein L,D-transpeptidase YafK
VWARGVKDDPFIRVLELPIMDVRARGRKLREGDYLTPEGCYQITDLNPLSAGHLSLRINYPNAADRAHADRERPGKDIFFHGGGFSTGCIPLGNPGIEQLYILVQDTRAASSRPIHVHIFPHRLDRSPAEVASAPLTKDRPELIGFWETLRPIYAAFEGSRRVPAVRISKAGEYEVVKSE